MISFQKSLYAKCIMVGEHAVLRGSPSLVFPLKKYEILLKYTQTDAPITCKFAGPYGDPLKLLFWSLLDSALRRVERKRSDLRGELELTSHLPLGGGLGASAAICVGVGYFLNQLGYVSDDKLFEFCRSLEDQFHGESSGIDIAVSFYGQAIMYRRGHDSEVFKPLWTPKLYLYYSGKKGITSETVNKVKALKETDPKLFEAMDLQMKKAVELCLQSLSESKSEDSFEKFRSSLQLAQNCFEQWDLVPPEVQVALTELTEAGALQCKLTGSGGGGYILSLWDKVPPKSLQDKMVELLF